MIQQKILIIGAGSWGTTIANLLAKKMILTKSVVKIWVRNEQLKREINNEHTNKKYTGLTLLHNNLKATTRLIKNYESSNIIIFSTPYPFIIDIINNINNNCDQKYNLDKKMGVLLSKGLMIKNGKPYPLCSHIEDLLNIKMCVLSGANVSKWILNEEPCEATIGYNDINIGLYMKKLFDCSYFKVDIINCIAPIELFGCLKNVVALAAGFIDGLGYHSNTKASIMRIGINEIIQFINHFFPIENTKTEYIFMENCGIGDIITSCFGGRNRLCAEEFVKCNEEINKMKIIEKKLLNGQKLQGPETCLKVHKILENNCIKEYFPLLVSVYDILYNSQDPSILVSRLIVNH